VAVVIAFCGPISWVPGVRNIWVLTAILIFWALTRTSALMNGTERRVAYSLPGIYPGVILHRKFLLHLRSHHRLRPGRMAIPVSLAIQKRRLRRCIHWIRQSEHGSCHTVDIIIGNFLRITPARLYLLWGLDK
jgi:hypothetical protein